MQSANYISFLKYKNKELYYNFVSGKTSPDKVLKELFLGENLRDTYLLEYDAELVSGILGTAKEKGLKSEFLDNVESLSKNEDISDTDIKKEHALMMMKKLNHYTGYKFVEHISSFIEIETI